MPEQNQDSAGAVDRAIWVDDRGLTVGSLTGPGEPVTPGVSHRYVAYWQLSGRKCVCNTCAQRRPRTYFGRQHPAGCCPMCGGLIASREWTDTPIQKRGSAGHGSWGRRFLDAFWLRDARRDERPRADTCAAEPSAPGLDTLLRKIAAGDFRELERYLTHRADRPSDDLLAALRPANRRDYEDWLSGFLNAGGKITTVCRYPFWTRRWHVATTHFVLDQPLVGINALNIIVPPGVEWSAGEDLGHCNVYVMDGYTHAGYDVPVFSDAPRP